MRKPIKFMRPSATVLVTAAAAAIIAASGTAFAAKLITGAQIANNSITGADIKQNSLTGDDIKPNSVTGADIKPGSVAVNDLAKGAITALNGTDGKDGAQGPKGDTGAAGPKGDTGAQGPKGDAGAPGQDGADGQDFTPAPAYGVGGVWIDAYTADHDNDPGTAAVEAFVPYGRYVSSAIPAGGDMEATVGGRFPFTCPASQADCRVVLSSAVAAADTTRDFVGQAHVMVEDRTLMAGDSVHTVTYCNAGEFANQRDGRRGAVNTIANTADEFEPWKTTVGGITNALTVKWGTYANCTATSGDQTILTLTPGHYYNIDVTFRYWEA